MVLCIMCQYWQYESAKDETAIISIICFVIDRRNVLNTNIVEMHQQFKPLLHN